MKIDSGSIAGIKKQQYLGANNEDNPPDTEIESNDDYTEYPEDDSDTDDVDSSESFID